MGLTTCRAALPAGAPAGTQRQGAGFYDGWQRYGSDHAAINGSFPTVRALGRKRGAASA